MKIIPHINIPDHYFILLIYAERDSCKLSANGMELNIIFRRLMELPENGDGIQLMRMIQIILMVKVSLLMK